MGIQQKPSRATNRARTQEQSGGGSSSSAASRDTERRQPLAVARGADNQIQGALAPSRRGVVGYGPSGTSQAIMRHMADDIEQLLQLFGFGGLGLSPTASQPTRTAWSPQIEVGRQDGNLVIRADLPGVTPDNVDVEVDDGLLTISGERRDEHREERAGFYRTERFYGQFYRAIPLPEGAKEDQVEGTFDNGVLELRIPVAEAEQRQRHRVAIGSRTSSGVGNGTERQRDASDEGARR